jgi:hypothetical protein
MDWGEAIRQGGLAVVCVAEGIAIGYLWRKLNDRDKDLMASYEARIKEARESTTALLTQTRLFDTLEKAVDLMTSKRKED